jgi:hypothetical protein
MKKIPIIQGGNSEAVSTAKNIRRYCIEETKQPNANPNDAPANTFIFCCGVCRGLGATLPQMFGALLWLGWELVKAKVRR